MASYKKKYLKTYFWSGLSLVLNFISMFIVAPLTTSMPEAYGIYALCISFNIFLNYADLGFISAGRKYAAEAYAVNNKEKEKKYVGTSIGIYGVMSLIMFIIALFFSGRPEYLIKGINNSSYYEMARKLLIILSLTIPFTIVQKFNNLIFSIRIEEYRIQSCFIVGSVLKIASVPLYFFNKRYDIVGYYLFCEVVNFLLNVYILWYSKCIGYGIRSFFKSLKFEKSIFNEIKPLALSGFVSVIGWITYYELDTVAISILLGANSVAIYAVGKQIQSFVRSLVGIVFSPFPVRINYFIGQKDYSGLKSFYYTLVEEFSFVVIPIVTIVLYSSPFVVAWLGNSYKDSILILQLLVLTFIIHHVTSQSVSVIYGLNKVKDILNLAVVKTLLFWIGVMATYKYLGVISFAIFQFIVCLITEFYYCHLTRKYLGYSRGIFYWDLLIKPLLVIITSCSVFWFISSPILIDVHKGHSDLLFVVSVMGSCCIFAFIMDLITNRSLRHEIINLLNK